MREGARSRPRSRLPMARLLASLFALFVFAASATAALAHAGLVAADPADGSVLAVAPAAISLTFTDPAAPTGFSLIGIGGSPQTLDGVTADGAVLRIALPAALADGSYLLSWRVTSADGHPISGTVSFAIGAVTGDIATAPVDATLAPAIWTVRLLQYLALMLGLGTLAFGLVAALPRRATAIGRGLTWLGLVLVPVAIGLQGLDLLGLPLPSVTTSAVWSAGLASSYGDTQLLFALAFLLAVLTPLAPGRPQKLLLAVAAIAGVLAPTFSGHASNAAPSWLTRPAVFIHLGSLLFWLGALLPLALLLRERSPASEQALRRFSRAIPYGIAGLVLSGTALSIIQLGPIGPLWWSNYGLLLAAKLALVALLLAIALFNRLRLTARVTSGDITASTQLRRSIAVELLLVVAILAVVAGWRFTPPPRVLEQIAIVSAPATATLSAKTAIAELAATPGRVGPVALALSLRDTAGAPIDASAVTLRLSMPDAGIATISRDAELRDDGLWHSDGVLLPVGGNWTVRAEARISAFDLLTLDGTLAITGPTVVASPKPVARPAVAPACPTGQIFTAGNITVSGAYSRAMLPNAPTAGAYFTIDNDGPDDDTLIGASSAVAAKVGLHEMAMVGDMMTMGPIETLPIAAGSTVTLEPSGYHLMFTQIASPFKEGDCVELTLKFAKAGDLPVTLNVGSIAQAEPVMDHDMAAMSQE